MREQHEISRKAKRKAKRLHRDAQLSERRQFAQRHGLLFDRNIERVQIVLPAIFSFHENYEETTSALIEMREVGLIDNRPMMVHFSDLEKIDPGAALVLVAEIFRIRNLRSHNAVTGTYPRSRNIYNLLSDMGFFQLLEIVDYDVRPKAENDPTQPVFLRFITSNRVESEMADNFVSVIEKHLFPMNDVARGKLVGAIIEAMNNTLDHAHPTHRAGLSMPDRWWLSSWTNVAEKEVMIMLFDQGVGVPRTLKPDVYDLIRAALRGTLQFRGKMTPAASDGEMIMAATELYRTGTGRKGRGRGFRNMKQFVNACNDGELRVLSNRGRYTYIPGTEACENESLSIGGTLIEWRFRHTGSVEMDDE